MARSLLASATPLALLAAGGLASCSLSRLQPATCASHADCKDAFGWDQVCAPEGTCEPLTLPDRCETIPADLLDNAASDYADAIPLGMLWWKTTLPAEADAAHLAIALANEDNGLGGRPFGLVSCNIEALPAIDALTGEEASVEMAAFLAEELGAVGIVGATASGDTLAAYPITSAADALLISPSSTSPALTDLDGPTCSDSEPGLLWRTVPPDSLQGEVMAAYLMGDLGLDLDDPQLDAVAVIYEAGPYGEGLQQAFDAAFDGDTTLYLFDNEADNAPTLISEAVISAADGVNQGIVFIGAKQDQIAVFLEVAASQEEVDDMVLMLADGGYQLDIFENAGDAADLFDNIRGTRPTLDDSSSAYRNFEGAFAGAYFTDAGASPFTAHAWDAAWLLLYGTAWADARGLDLNGTNLAKGLRHVSGGEPIDITRLNWTHVQAAFSAGQSIDVYGASGSLDYDGTTCETSAPIEIWTVENNGGDVSFGTKGTVQP